MKYIHFGEDVRPPYYGTYTKSYTDKEAARLARNPASRLRQDTNYDYDSEAEWDEPEEGEDLDSEGDDDADEEAEDDMDGFLDDEEDPQLKRRLISGDLEPISTGLCWQDGQGVSRLNDGSGAICTDFREFSMGFLLRKPSWTLQRAS
jgi:chromatin assembly factor 1 subunit A